MEIFKCDRKAEHRKYRKSLLKKLDFAKKIDLFSDIIDRISQMSYSHPKFLSAKRKRLLKPIGMEASLSSLEGIKGLCEIGDVVDAFVLLRKVRDNLFLDLFLMSEAINNHTPEMEFDFPFGDLNDEQIVEKLVNYINAIIDSEEHNKNLQAINQWMDGDYVKTENKCERKKYFGYFKYLERIEEKCPELKACHTLFLDALLGKLENQLNNYVHSNSPAFLSNLSVWRGEKYYINSVKSFLSAMDDLKRIFIIDLYFIDSTLFAADDYLNNMDMGMEPIEGSQYYVSNEIVDEFDNIRRDNPELYEFLKCKNRYEMECFKE